MPDPLESDERLALGELLNHVLDKGVVISGDVTISVADIDLIRVGLALYLTSVESVASPHPTERDALPVLRG